MKLVLALGVAFGLAGCVKPDGSSDMKQNIEAVCAGVDLGYILFGSFEERVKPSMVLKVEAGYTTVKIICANPPTNNSEALIAVLRAAANFNKALAEAKALAG